MVNLHGLLAVIVLSLRACAFMILSMFALHLFSNDFFFSSVFCFSSPVSSSSFNTLPLLQSCRHKLLLVTLIQLSNSIFINCVHHAQHLIAPFLKPLQKGRVLHNLLVISSPLLVEWCQSGSAVVEEHDGGDDGVKRKRVTRRFPVVVVVDERVQELTTMRDNRCVGSGGAEDGVGGGRQLSRRRRKISLYDGGGSVQDDSGAEEEEWRWEAYDSRTFGPVQITDIVGRVIYCLRSAVEHGRVQNSQSSMQQDLPVLEVELDVDEMAKNHKA
ncbi:hypothetical protein PIB30_096793 [Stylosanthes scabra]|uniref:Uncharacterized protein n=1 Tax=Stylosanthes scabra TaxID=79078 RepID=A0ABU6YTQ5_9FABA|nr:hypothetical protein [Stylosanthes scabra]